VADLPSRRDLFQTGRRSIVTTSGVRINPRVIDIEGSDINIILGAMALMGEEVVASLAANMANLFVETAVGDCLDRVAFDRYQITRLPAAPATVTLTLTRPAFTFGAFTYAAGSRVQTAAGLQFATDVDVVFGATDLVKTVNATALVAGADGNAPTGSLTQFVDAPADTTLTVSNINIGVFGEPGFIPGGAAGGVEAETDPDFRSRILGFFPTVRRATQGAIQFGALQVPGVAVARASEVNNFFGAEVIPAGIVQLIIADRNGGFSATMLTAVRNKQLEFRALGIPVYVTGGNVVFQPVTWHVTYLAGINQQAAQEDLRAVTVAVAQFLNPGETLLRAALIAAARTIPGIVVGNDALVTPIADTETASITDLIRIQAIDITFT
jgi:uncharacterized phage protein gp47/JayE